MAKEYFEKLSDLVNRLNIEEEVSLSVELKHFFSGAALYAYWLNMRFLVSCWLSIQASRGRDH